jgi:hypothetical protein
MFLLLQFSTGISNTDPDSNFIYTILQLVVSFARSLCVVFLVLVV